MPSLRPSLHCLPWASAPEAGLVPHVAGAVAVSPLLPHIERLNDQDWLHAPPVLSILLRGASLTIETNFRLIASLDHPPTYNCIAH